MQIESGITVLFMDDDQPACAEVETLFALRRIDCKAVCDIDRAREVLSAEPTRRIVVTDFHMPGISGPEAIELLRREYDREFAFIVLTGDETQAAAIEALRAQALDFLRKPIDPKLLIQAVNRASERLKTTEAGSEKIGQRNFFEALPDLAAELHQKERMLERMTGATEGRAISPGCSREDVGALLRRAREMRRVISERGTVTDLTLLELTAKEARRLVRMVGDIVTDADNIGELRLRPTSVTSFIEEFMLNVEEVAAAKKVEIRVRSTAPAGTIRADVRRLQAALIALVQSFADRTEASTKLLVLIADEQDQVAFTFKISAPGGCAALVAAVANEALADVAVAAPLTQEKIGLALSRMVVGLHGGCLEFIEPRGQSSWLEVRLPCEWHPVSPQRSRRLAAAH
jgi:FixJ family two-component response regulator